jgi:hypothetical protein
MLIAGYGCAGKAPPPSAEATSDRDSDVAPQLVKVGRYGISCRRPGGDPTPPSYLVSDLGKPGVAILPPDEAALVRRLTQHVHSKTLRFVLVNRDPFIVLYDAYPDEADLCQTSPSGPYMYNVSGNLTYLPGLDDENTAPGDIPNTPGPWMTPESQCDVSESTVPVGSGCTFGFPAPIWSNGTCNAAATYHVRKGQDGGRRGA